MTQYYNNTQFICEFYNLNGSSAKCEAYIVSLSNIYSPILDGTNLITQNVSNIQKVVYNGSFTYNKLELICTFADKKVEGFVTVHDYDEFVWSIGLINFTMIRANSKTNSLKSQLEQEYQSKYAK